MQKINKELDRIIRKHSQHIKNLAHVGAHLGQEVQIYKNVNIQNIHLFEPQKDVWEKLNENVKNYENIITYNFALGSSTKTEKLFKTSSNNGASSSILKPKLHKEIQKNIKFEEVENIEIKRFDELNISDINFLTIDVQGFELEVIKGFGDCLNQVDFIFSEINKKFLYENNVLIKDLDKYLGSNDFIRAATFWDPYLPYGDAFYIRSKYLTSYQKIYLKVKKLYQDSFINILFLKLIHPKKLIYKIKKLILN